MTGSPSALSRTNIASVVIVAVYLIFQILQVPGGNLLLAGLICLGSALLFAKGRSLSLALSPVDISFAVLVFCSLLLQVSSQYPANSESYARQMSAFFVLYVFVRCFVITTAQRRLLYVLLGLFLLILSFASVLVTELRYLRLARLDAGALLNFRDQIFCLPGELPAAWITVFLVMLPFPLLMCLYDKATSKSVPILAGLTTALTLAAIGLSFSRGLYLATAAFCLLAAAGLLLKRVISLRALLRFGLPVLTLAAALLIPVSKSVLYTLSAHHSDSQARSLQGRFHVWDRSLQMIAHHHLFGIGPGNFPLYYVHFKLPGDEDVFGPFNVGLHILIEQGLIGAITYSAVGLCVLWLLARQLTANRKDINAACMAMLFLSTLAALLVRDSSYSSLLTPNVFVVLALMTALAAGLPSVPSREISQ